MKSNELPHNKIIEEYKNGKSPYELAEQYNTYPNMIRRILKRYNVELRDKSEAQKNALANGVPHPTKGRERTQEELINISRGLSKAYEKLSDEEKRIRSNRAKQQWDLIDDTQKEKFNSAAIKAVLAASKAGSKLEHSIVEGIRRLGYACNHHSNVVDNEKMEVDIFVPSHKVCIEVDGPSHFRPIWGEEKLKKTQESDAEKNGLLISRGFIIIRIRMVNKPSLARTADLLSKLDVIFKQVDIKFPEVENRYIELEV